MSFGLEPLHKQLSELEHSVDILRNSTPDTIPLNEVIYDRRARDGTWCTLPYPPNHENGCKEYPDCINQRPDFRDLNYSKWWAIIETYDLRSHALRMLFKHKWTSRWMQRNRRHWQKQVIAKLKKKAEAFAAGKLGQTIILDVPEACGVNLFATMAKHGIYLRTDPDLVYKIMLVGVK